MRIRRRVLLAVLLSIALTALPSYYVFNHWQIGKVSIYLIIENINDQPKRDYRGWIYLSSKANETLDFSGASLHYDRQNISEIIYEPQYGRMAVNVNYISAKRSVTVNFTNIPIQETTDFSASPNQLGAIYGYLGETKAYSFTTYYAQTNLGEISAISVFTNSTLSKGQHSFTCYYRVLVYPIISSAFSVMLFFSILGTLLAAFKLPFSRRYPLVTCSVVLLSLFLYVFVGTVFEIKLHPLISNGKSIFSLLAIFLHGDYTHLAGNMPPFILLGTLLEYWLGIRVSIKTFVKTYLLFLLLPLILSVGGYLTYGQYGAGLSLSIEGLSFSIWCYIIQNWKKSVVKRWDILGLLLSGLSMGVFYNWSLFHILFQLTASKYDLDLALGHIMYGIISGVIATLVYFYRTVFKAFDLVKKKLLDIFQRVIRAGQALPLLRVVAETLNVPQIEVVSNVH